MTELRRLLTAARPRPRTAWLFMFVLWSLLIPKMALAIPSPELVIGSVSSLSQILAVGFAAVTGAGAVIARRLGFSAGSRHQTGRFPARLVTALVLVGLALGALNIWQYRVSQAKELAHLQSTLIRPAQFDGTQIQDENLKETSFDKQNNSPLAISTDVAQSLLNNQSTEQNTLFFDVRETAEHRMGTLPGAQHVRFPDFLASNIPMTGKQVVLFCHNGNRSSETCAELAARGIDCRFIAGGIEKWIVEGRAYSDKDVKTLSDLRAIPPYPGKDTLLSTADFEELRAKNDLQIVDTRYPGDFATGHLPGAINIPLRALPTDQLLARIESLQDKPTIAACYDRRSCFMSQVLGLELSEAGIEFLGRYTTPWEYFTAPPPKPHVQEWLAEQQTTYWQTGIDTLAAILTWIGDRSHFVAGLLALSLLSRLMVLPIALKSERDQIVMAQHADELKSLKDKLAGDPTRKARAIQQFYADKNLTPLRNLTALLFLPVMMLGLSATEQSAKIANDTFLWTKQLGEADPTFLWPLAFVLIACVYLNWAVAKNNRQALLWWLIGGPLLFALTFRLSAAGNIYLCISLLLLLTQRAYVTGHLARIGDTVSAAAGRWIGRNRLPGVVPLAKTTALTQSGNKAYRLSVLKGAGIPVPDGLVLQAGAIRSFEAMSAAKKRGFARKISNMVGDAPCAVRSSASSEDGAAQSFAGVFESELNVQPVDMVGALEKVIASFSSARAKSYDSQTNDHEGNILIQHMIVSEYAGVLFTQDPTAPGLAMIELVEGCGDDLVSGRATPQSLRYGRYTHIAVHEESAPIELAPLLALGQKAEAIFGCPQDIEWTYSQGEFQIVQSRDITTLSSGGAAERARKNEWRRIFAMFADAEAGANVLEQDEMSEVLPRPTRLSFSLMGELWAPGGSLDLACRQLGLRYNLPEGRSGHLVSFFGRTFVDCELKRQMALKLSAAKARQMRKQAKAMLTAFPEQTIPALHDDLAVWEAIDFTALSTEQIVNAIEKLKELLVQGIYVEAEKINILTGFAQSEAETFANGNAELRKRLMHPHLHHAPVSMIDACARLKGKARKRTLLSMMGHRAVFDYELSMPRYSEKPELLWPLLSNAAQQSSDTQPLTPATSGDPVDLAIALQDLKERAKHEALRVVAHLRRALLALSDRTDLGELIFHLSVNEVLALSEANAKIYGKRAQKRMKLSKRLLKTAPKQHALTLHDCELLSAPTALGSRSDSATLGGTCVAGSAPASGRVFVVEDETATDTDAFTGFREGDIIVCRMVSPAWLPFVSRSGGVLSEVGGWLSHMAIVAREKDVMMCVGCSALDQLQTGMVVNVGMDGSITLQQDNVPELRQTG